MKLFRDLSPEEEKRFRQWARDNYKRCEPISGVWHPVVQDECVKMNSEPEAVEAGLGSDALELLREVAKRLPDTESRDVMRLCDAGFRERDWARTCLLEGKFPKDVTLDDLLAHGTYDPHRDEISITVKGVPFTYEVRRA